MSGMLCVPREVWNWANPEHRNAYVDLQFRASWGVQEKVCQGQRVTVQPGEVLFSAREAMAWWGWSEKAVRVFMERLQAEELVSYPEGQQHRRMYRVALADYWGEKKGARKGASRGESKGATKPASNNELQGVGAQGEAQGRAQAGAGHIGDYTAGNQKDTSVPSEPAGEAAGGRALVVVHGCGDGTPDPDRMTGGELLREWITRQPARPSEREVGKQAAAAKRICDDHTRPQIAAAWWGLTHRFPWARPPNGRSAAWDLMTLEKEFVMSVQYAAEHHPDIKARRLEAEFEQATLDRAAGF